MKRNALQGCTEAGSPLLPAFPSKVKRPTVTEVLFPPLSFSPQSLLMSHTGENPLHSLLLQETHWKKSPPVNFLQRATFIAPLHLEEADRTSIFFFRVNRGSHSSSTSGWQSLSQKPFISTVKVLYTPAHPEIHPSIPIHPSIHPLIGLGVLNHSMVI